jgi:hypothetical protein
VSIWRSTEEFEREWESRVAEARRRTDTAGFVARLAQRIAVTEERGAATVIGTARRGAQARATAATATATAS